MLLSLVPCPVQDSDHALFKSQFKKAVQLRLAELKKQQRTHSEQEVLVEQPSSPERSKGAATKAPVSAAKAPAGAAKDPLSSIVNDSVFQQEEQALHTPGLVQEAASDGPK